jgi:DNA-binding XRE family transcriptional regulator
LAELVGTSQQQIQRIETSKLAARLELATKLAAALRTPLARLFPAAAKSLRKVAKAREERRAPDEEEIRELAKAGLEADARAWYFQARLRGHKESLQFQISPTEQRWLFGKVQLERSHTEGLTFVIFETASDRIAINTRELVYCHFLFELSYFVEEEAPELSTSVEVFFSGDIEPVTFSVEPDTGSTDDEEDEGQFRNIFFDLDLDPQPEDRIYFEDEDGEDVFLRSGDVALLRVPLFVLDPEFEAEDEDLDVGEDDGEPPPVD